MKNILLDNISYTYPGMTNPVFENYTLELPSGIISLIGQNGTGKSTLLLLAGGVLLPTKGKVLIQGVDTRDIRDEQKRQEFVSFVYQNMEFETEENIDYLLKFVYENGFHTTKHGDFIKELCDVFELQKLTHKKTQELSKGELQRTILAFSLLYGSRILMLDEPFFAMEPRQREKSMQFLCGYAAKNKTSVYYSVHELEISREYSDYILLFHKNSTPEIGTTKEMFTREKIEKAYEVPFILLKQKETLYRDNLKSHTEYHTPQAESTEKEQS